MNPRLHRRLHVDLRRTASAACLQVCWFRHPAAAWAASTWSSSCS